MSIKNISDDDSDGQDGLYVLDRSFLEDLARDEWMISEEDAFRTSIDERRGLVLAQAVVLEDLLGDCLLALGYKSDQEDPRALVANLTLGRRVKELKNEISQSTQHVIGFGGLIGQIEILVAKRNDLAHGSLLFRPVGRTVIPISELISGKEHDYQWLLRNPRRADPTPVSLLGLRSLLFEFQSVASEVLDFLWSLGWDGGDEPF